MNASWFVVFSWRWIESDSLFEREHHVRIAAILQAIDPQALANKGCLFGGGTAIALAHGEYRESIDIDFLISDLNGYRDLRQSLTQSRGLTAITRQGSTIQLARELRMDQYGIRTMIVMDGTQIKFEIGFEARIDLELPKANDRICGIASLTRLDMATTKLLANADRFADDAVFSRDLIDLAMIDAPNKTFAQAIAKAREAYGDSIEQCLTKAIARLRERPGRLEACMTALKINRIPKALLLKRIKRLASL